MEEVVNDDRKLVKKFGKLRANKIRQRLSSLRFADTLEDVKMLPGKFHELTGDRKGQWACDLDQPCRLVFVPQEYPVPVNREGQYIWKEIRGVEIVEITNYHSEKN